MNSVFQAMFDASLFKGVEFTIRRCPDGVEIVARNRSGEQEFKREIVISRFERMVVIDFDNYTEGKMQRFIESIAVQ